MALEHQGVSHVVLIAEDDAATLAGWAAYVHDAGFSVVPASSFAEAHRLLPFVRPDVLVTDIRLGEYNGLQLVVQAGTLRPRPVRHRDQRLRGPGAGGRGRDDWGRPSSSSPSSLRASWP